MKDLEKYRGCLIGGAVGDALGFPVEFVKDSHIFQKYGERGITEYSLVNGVASISDDTQMTLFTANGLLLGTTRAMTRGIMGSYPSYVALCYKDWLRTQTADEFGFEPPEYAWLNNVPEMNHSREPGRTCIRCLMHDNLGSIASPSNNSKGCGGVMRVAPIGLYFEGKCYTSDEIDMIGAETAALTHGHELGYIPAAMLVHIIHLLAHKPEVTVLEAVVDAKKAVSRLFPHAEHLGEMLDLTDNAIRLAGENEVDELVAISGLGEGWVAEETLAIAIYCSIKFENDFEKAIIASVNHSGDSDSTGALTGNILGARLGMKAIPEKFLRNLELRDTILEIADDLFHDCKITEHGDYRDEVWEQKYIYHTYPNH
ncbi:ADP-ribosylglycohydrolase family protein [Feifania hominis]|uniref:ADP-ribosylglycohydrolase family protein n=1 Tax=Feifania hominis TaxID=2763660 RepID=A0A926DDA5_9FIRM|nr:ADP-ribosylglycohydrolase family protein [Feifania hominis]MBC8535736.1 ADP-ribosylglycohydrolase family protein [Feifania hominis]